MDRTVSLVLKQPQSPSSALPSPHTAAAPLPLPPDWSDAAATARPSRVYAVVKRSIDVAGAIVGLLLFAPVCLVIAALVVGDSGGPIFHRRRVLAHQAYKEGQPPQGFDAFKFRTMRQNADELLQQNPELLQRYQQEFKLKDDPRVTRFGARLRRTSLDELPQLWNVLMGQMTLVGPRMISPPELALYGVYAGKLLSVKPGLTGLWQVSGRQHISYRERIRLDMEYIENRSLLLEMEILLRTVVCVVTGRGAF